MLSLLIYTLLILPARAEIPPGASWYWQLSGDVKMNIGAQVYDIDLFDNSAGTFAALKARGKTVICYFSGGSYENWRPDAGRFPAAVLGRALDGWPGERWLDVRATAVREIMKARLDLAKAKGCDGVEPDNVDGYSNNNGFGLTKAHQTDYNKFLAREARARGLLIGLKNSTDLVGALVGSFDFAVVEQCYQYRECAAYRPFISQGKAVLIAEYQRYSTASCADAKRNGFSLVYYNLSLDGSKYQPCR